MFIDTCTDREDVDIEDYVFRIYSCFFSKQSVRSFAYFYLPVICSRLSVLVKGHNDHCCTQTPDRPCLFNESLGAFLKADGIHDTFALGVLQTGQNSIPMRRVYHQRRLRYCRVIRYIADETLHFLRAVQHGVVHVYVNDRSSVLYLSGCYLQRLVIFSLGDQACELTGARYIGPFSDICEVVASDIYCYRLQTADFQWLVRNYAMFSG